MAILVALPRTFVHLRCAVHASTANRHPPPLFSACYQISCELICNLRRSAAQQPQPQLISRVHVTLTSPAPRPDATLLECEAHPPHEGGSGSFWKYLILIAISLLPKDNNNSRGSGSSECGAAGNDYGISRWAEMLALARSLSYSLAWAKLGSWAERVRVDLALSLTAALSLSPISCGCLCYSIICLRSKFFDSFADAHRPKTHTHAHSHTQQHALAIICLFVTLIK